MVDLIKVVDRLKKKKHHNKYFLNAVMLEVLPFESQVGQKC